MLMEKEILSLQATDNEGNYKYACRGIDAGKTPTKEMIPAPIDEKNIATSWIEDIFDDQSCVWGKKCAVGFISGEPVIAAWDQNILTWHFPITRDFENSLALARLKDMLEKYSEYDPELVEHYNVAGKTLMQKFYWKDE